MHLTLNARFRNRPLTGVERFASEVTALLAKRDDTEIYEVCPDQPLAGLRGHAWEQFSLPRQIESGDSILFSPCNTGPVSVKRQLAVIHDAAVWDCPDAFSRSFRMLYQALLPRLAKRAEAVATVSEFSRDRLAHHLKIPAEKIHVLGNATRPDFCPAPETTPAPEAPTLLCVGSLDPRKNFSRLIDAWITLTQSGRLPENARLNIIGSAKPSNFSQFEVVDAPGIHWLGRVTDEELIDHYRTSTAFIFPSLYEGFGLPPLEAMACGCPLLLSTEASLPEVGGDAFDPKTPDSTGAAIYFDPKSEAAIASAIESILSLHPSSLTQLRTNALTRASRFSWETVADRTFAAAASI